MSSGSKAQTLGYRYFFTLQMGLGRGPINELLEIRVGDKLAWVGSQTTSGTIAIQAANLFGGDKGEGGIEGTMDVCMGDKTQGQNGRMVGMRGALLSAYRGVTTFVYDGLVCSMNPYPKPWRFRVRRTTAGWDRPVWYPERCDVYFYDSYTALDAVNVPVSYLGNPDFYENEDWARLVAAELAAAQEEQDIRRRTINAMNPAHMLIEIATNKSWGRQMPDDQIDWDSYKLGADTMYCEGFGLCMKWNRQTGVDEVVSEIINTIGAFQYVSRVTGKLTLRLIRADYDVDALPVFTRTSGILSIEAAESSGSDSGFNEVIVKYKTALTGKPASVRYSNLGSTMSDGGINSTTTEYLGIPDRNLALRVAARDVRSNTGDIKRLKMTFDRRGYPLEPGSVFVLSDPELGIGSMVMRVVEVTNEDYVNGSITITCLTDVFGLPLTTYVGADENPQQGENGNPALPVDQRLVEATYRSVYEVYDRANFELLDDDTTFVGAVAVRANQANTAFDLLTKAQGETTWGETPGAWANWGLLPDEISPTDFVVTFKDAVLLEVEKGQAALVDDEIVVVTGVDQESMTVTFGRGCLDTVPAWHEKGTRVWFYETGNTQSEREFVGGEQVTGKVISYSGSGTMLESLTPTLTLDTVGRFGKPYVPGDVRLNGISVFDTPELETGMLLSWARRNRVTQMDIIYDHDAADITPEELQTCTVRVSEVGTGVVLVEYPDVEGTEQLLEFTTTAEEIMLELFAVRDGRESFQAYRLTYGYNGVSFVTKDNLDRYVSERGHLYIAED